MAIDWNKLEDNIKNILKSKKPLTYNDIAMQLSQAYTKEMLDNGSDAFGNKILSLNYAPLAASLKKGMELSSKTGTGSPAPLNMLGMNGVIISWLSATMEFKVPPSGTTSVVSNNVIFPGSVVFMNIKKDSKEIETDLAKEYTNALKKHSAMVSGICVAIVPGTPPIPTPFTWTGIL